MTEPRTFTCNGCGGDVALPEAMISGDRADIEIVVTSRDGEQAVEWVENIEAAVEEALPEEWY